MDLTSTLVPIFICVVLPVSIVLIVYLAAINRENKRAQVLLKAIEANNNIDADKLAEAMRKPKKSAREILNKRLLYGNVFSLLGIAFCIIGLSGIIPDHHDFELFLMYLVSTVSIPVGLGFLITYFVTRKSVDK